MILKDRILKADRLHKTQVRGFHYWGASVIKHQSRYYFFCDRWSDSTFNNWLFSSSIIVATSNQVIGPYTNHIEISELTSQPWCDSVGNPYIFKWKGKYYLYYTGNMSSNRDYKVARESQRIGVAVSDHPQGPWQPFPNNPVLDVRPDNWDYLLVNNPVVFTDLHGELRMIYKSQYKNELRLGTCTANSPEGPWTGRSSSPDFICPHSLEDPSVWYESGQYHMIAKAMDSSFIKFKQGLYLTSADGLNWEISSNSPAYDTTIYWADDTATFADRVEKPFIYYEGASAKAIFFAVKTEAENSFNIGSRLQPI